MRTIDADALKRKFRNVNEGMFQLSRVYELIDNAPEEKSYAMGYQDGLEDGLQDIRPQGETNSEIFKQTFGIYATELWSMKEADFLEWLNAEAKKDEI